MFGGEEGVVGGGDGEVWDMVLVVGLRRWR